MTWYFCCELDFFMSLGYIFVPGDNHCSVGLVQCCNMQIKLSASNKICPSSSHQTYIKAHCSIMKPKWPFYIYSFLSPYIVKEVFPNSKPHPWNTQKYKNQEIGCHTEDLYSYLSLMARTFLEAHFSSTHSNCRMLDYMTLMEC